jgi:2-oxoisovalerate dehydrogenase E2 component (dihydrolipoyl transacylase)
VGRYVFKLPDLGEGMTAGEIAAWHVKVGDKIAKDDLLVDVMTDKATVEITSPVAGTVKATHGEVGADLPVGSPLIEFEVEGAGNAEMAEATARVAAAPAKPVEAPKIERAARPLASPAVRARAREGGIDLKLVAGTGPEGRITHDDLAAYGSGVARAEGDVTEVKVIGLRRKIAARMQDAKRRIPHFSYVEEIDMTALEAVRERLNAVSGKPRLNPLPFIMRALVQVLPKFPQINARYDDEAGVVHRHAAVHIGIATQTPNGLMVPVVTNAQGRDLWSSAAEVARLAEAARAGTATRAELSGSTITITSLGPLSGILAIPVINAPEVAILCPNRIVERPVAKDGGVFVRKMMNLSAAFDHRVVDGHDAASFIQAMKQALENPDALAK